MSSYSFIVHLPLATGWVNSTRLCWMGMDSINGFPLPPRSTGRVEDIEKGFTSLAGLWGLKLGCAPPIERFLEKKERLEAEDCTWKWKLCLPKTIFWIRGLPLYRPCLSPVKCAPCHATLTATITVWLTTKNSTSSCISGSSAVPRNGSKIYGDNNFPTDLWEIYFK